MDPDVIVWTTIERAEEFGLSDLGTDVPTQVCTGDAEFAAHVPPREKHRAYLVDAAAVRDASLPTLALLAGRPGWFPPVVLFGDHAAQLALVPVEASSWLVLEPGAARERLRAAVTYWGLHNTSPTDLLAP